MNQISHIALSRRAILAGSGAIVIGFAASDPAGAAEALPIHKLSPDQLDSFIAIQKDGTVVALYGKMDPGQGVDVAIGQIVADELDVPMSMMRVIQGDTAYTLNQGGASGSTGVEKGGKALRYAAAEARRVLVERASARLGVPVDQLATADGAVFVRATPSKRVTYAALVADGGFQTTLQWNKIYGNDLFSPGQAKPKNPSEYRVVGTSVPRQDIRANVFGKQLYVTDIRLPGMLHARVIRPPVAGTTPVSIDESSIKHIQGVRVIHDKAILAVLAEKEWNAIRAQEALAVTWSKPAEPPFPEQSELFDHIRAAPILTRKDEVKKGDVDAAITGAARQLSAEYEWPFQGHASMVGACAVVDVRPDGVTAWTGTQKPHFAQMGISRLLDVPHDKVRAIWVRGPGSYGRNDAGDAVLEAALLSKAAGRPVRLQYSRDQGTGWDPKGPASVHRCHAGLDAQGHIVGYSFVSKGPSRVDVDVNESDPRDTLAGQMLGLGRHPTQGFGYPTEGYDYGAANLAWETIPPLLENASPLRTGHLRDPVGPQINFASESFIDELAAAAGADPVEFRLRHLKDPRSIAVVKAAIEKFGWQPRPAATAHDTAGDIARGRGVALALRGETLCAAMVEIELNRRTGAVRPTRWAVAHDCGLVINPDTLRRTIEGNIIHGTSRALLEEIKFSRETVTSVDWLTYPILDIRQTPDRIDIAVINRPDLPASGAGEASTRPVAAAIANAIFDATGVRLRRAPFTPARIKAALA
jgi:nicotinate dehydrogenase subunit B